MRLPRSAEQMKTVLRNLVEKTMCRILLQVDSSMVIYVHIRSPVFSYAKYIYYLCIAFIHCSCVSPPHLFIIHALYLFIIYASHLTSCIALISTIYALYLFSISARTCLLFMYHTHIQFMCCNHASRSLSVHVSAIQLEVSLTFFSC